MTIASLYQEEAKEAFELRSPYAHPTKHHRNKFAKFLRGISIFTMLTIVIESSLTAVVMYSGTELYLAFKRAALKENITTQTQLRNSTPGAIVSVQATMIFTGVKFWVDVVAFSAAIVLILGAKRRHPVMVRTAFSLKIPRIVFLYATTIVAVTNLGILTSAYLEMINMVPLSTSVDPSTVSMLTTPSIGASTPSTEATTPSTEGTTPSTEATTPSTEALTPPTAATIVVHLYTYYEQTTSTAPENPIWAMSNLFSWDLHSNANQAPIHSPLLTAALRDAKDSAVMMMASSAIMTAVFIIVGAVQIYFLVVENRAVSYYRENRGHKWN